MVPSVIPISTASVIAERPSLALTGRPSAISSVTVKSLFL